jgi:RimJ/RimL family protein N-acetyltransferase
MAVGITTRRLVLRPWLLSDRQPFAAINGDPEVMAHYPSPLAPDQSDALMDRLQADIDTHGFGLWALEHRESSELLGFVGLRVVSPSLPFAPAVELGWRLRRTAWGHGYATEAAAASALFGFEKQRLDEVVAMATAANRPSHRVMLRLGMTRDLDGDFTYEETPERSTKCVLYRLPGTVDVLRRLKRLPARGVMSGQNGWS